MSERNRQPASFRLARLWSAADQARIPLRTIIATVLVVGACWLSVTLIYRLRDVVLLLLVAGFVALILNPLVLLAQRVTRSRGSAVTVVTLAALAAFIGVAFAFGYPLVDEITRLANRLPDYVASATQGRGWIGHLVVHYHVQHWVEQNAPKLVTFGQDLSGPALAFGKGALSLIIELTTTFVLVLLLLWEGPKMRRGILSLLTEGQAAEMTALAAEINRAVIGYMFGNFLTSAIAGLVVFTTLTIVGVPFPVLWGLWVALVDFLPMIGGALAGIPTVLFAFTQSTSAGIATAVVFVVYTQIENHILNPIVMSKTVRISPLLVLIAVLVGASLGDLFGGAFGGFVAALLSIPAAGALQVIVRVLWRISGPPPGSGSPDLDSAGAGSRDPGQPETAADEDAGVA